MSSVSPVMASLAILAMLTLAAHGALFNGQEDKRPGFISQEVANSAEGKQLLEEVKKGLYRNQNFKQSTREYVDAVLESNGIMGSAGTEAHPDESKPAAEPFLISMLIYLIIDELYHDGKIGEEVQGFVDPIVDKFVVYNPY